MFVLYSALCFWVIFLDGAETLEGWGAFALFGWFAASLTPSELKFYIGISWLVSLVFTLMAIFGSSSQ